MAGSETRERILDAAEELFAMKGIGNASTRDITTAAGVNLASVNYHFGSKEGLVEELLARRIVPINEERKLMLYRVQEQKKEALSVEDILRAFLEPPNQLMETSERKRNFMAIMGQVHLSPDKRFQRFIHELFKEVFVLFYEALCKALPDVDASEVLNRFSFVIGARIHTIMQMQHGGESPFFGDMPVRPRKQKNINEQLIVFARKGMEG